MKLYRIKSKLSKVQRLMNELDEAMNELSAEAEKVFGEGHYASAVDGDGIVIKNEDDDLTVALMDTVIKAAENDTFTKIDDYKF